MTKRRFISLLLFLAVTIGAMGQTEMDNDVKRADAKTKLLNLLDSCMNRKEVVTLRIIKAKEKK